MRLQNALMAIAINPEALRNRSTAENAAMRWMYETTQLPNRAVTLNQLISNNFRLRQRFAVISLDFATQGGRPKAPRHASGDIARSLNECRFEGVTCNGSNRVTRINWAGENLQGYISEEIGYLTSMTFLDLGENALGGTLPDSLYDLVNLQYLYLHSNQIGGKIS